MNGSLNQQQLLANSVIHITDAATNEETPLTDQQLDAVDEPQSSTPTGLDWNTSLISKICREGDIDLLREFAEYSQQTLSCGKHAAEIADRLDIETGLSPLHHAARYQQLHICLMLLSRIQFELGVNIKDEHGRTPIHSAFRLSNNSSGNKSEAEKLFKIEDDFGSEIQDSQAWQDEYTAQILTSDHPLIYLFAKAKGDLNARDKYHLTPLHHAVARNNLGGVKQLISFSVSIEARDRQGMRPLHYACKEGYLAIVQYLIEKDAKIDAVDDDNYMPLHYACAKGHLEIIKFIQSKVQTVFQKLIQARTNTKASCLHLAVQYGNISSVEYILNAFSGDQLKIVVNEQAEPLGTPLHIAAKFCDPPLINLLYHHGANPLLLNSLDQSALHIASLFNRLAIVKELLALTQTSLLEIKDSHGQTALSVTTNTGIIDELITSGADISSCDRKRMNALMIAVSNNRVSIVEHLLFAINDRLPNIFEQVTRKNRLSIFLLAVHTGSVPMCSALFNHPHIRWDTLDKNRMNIFHIAARDGHYELMEFLCDQIRKSVQMFSLKSVSYCLPSADWDAADKPQPSPILRLYIDAQDEDGRTPLHVAAERGHRLCVEVLLKYGADVLLTDFLGQSALHAAIQNDHSRCVEILLRVSMRNMADFQSILSRRQAPLITACENGFTDIVRLLLSHGIGIDHQSDENGPNPLEIAIKYQQTAVIDELLEHSHADEWLMSIRKSKEHIHQTPLRDMIEHTPQCAKHAFDRFITKTREIDADGNPFERTTYTYKYIDDYFTNNQQLYDTNRRHLYRNHPFIIALDSDHHFLFEHPLARQLLERKWRLYRPIFYFYLILRLLLLLLLSFYVLIAPAPNIQSAAKKSNSIHLAIRWAIVALGGINLFRLMVEILQYRGLRVPFAQIIGFISFLTSIVAFLPFRSNTEMRHWQWELAAFSTLLQWFNMAFESRPVPFIGTCFLLFQSILFNFLSLIFVALPLLVAFTIATNMIFYNQGSFLTNFLSIHKLSAMILGEFEFEKLFFSRPTLEIARWIFIPFMIIMTIVFMNLFLGLTIDDTQNCLNNARLKAKSYRTREVIYIETTLPSLSRLRLHTIENETVNVYPKGSGSIRTDEENEGDDENVQESLLNRQRSSDPNKLLEILNMLCTQAKHVLDKEISLERLLRQLLSARMADVSKSD